jgi:epoxyqueuosine reductase
LTDNLTDRVKAHAAELGFVACAIAEAQPLPEVRERFRRRIAEGGLSGLPWMNLERAERATTPDRALEGVRTIVSVAAAYQRTSPLMPDDSQLRGRIARYAWGRDYHRVLERSLKQLSNFIEAEAPGSRSRVLVDYGPLAERAYAARAGMGWFGKSTNLLLPGTGSWVLLGEVLSTAMLQPDPPLKKTCGSCRRCVQACPTGAIVDGYVLDNDRCISYQTIENRGPIARELRPLIGDWLFGCDICQEVCPVGQSASPKVVDPLATDTAENAAPALLPLLSLTVEEFRSRFAGRAILRAKRDGLIRNACVVLGNLGDPRAVPDLQGALNDASALVRGHAAWALGQLGGESARTALQDRVRLEDDAWVTEELRAALRDLDSGPTGAARQ